jgi:hypothetical protein
LHWFLRRLSLLANCIATPPCELTKYSARDSTPRRGHRWYMPTKVASANAYLRAARSISSQEGSL